jgi:hypothetical protein
MDIVVFLATHSQIFELCVDRLVGICMGDTLRIPNFKILSQNFSFLVFKATSVASRQISSNNGPWQTEKNIAQIMLFIHKNS